MEFHIVEKKNPLHLHAICSTEARAKDWINVKAVEYCKRGFFMDKTLTPSDFEIKKVLA